MGGTRPRLLTRVPSLTGAIERTRLLELVAAQPIVALAAPAGSGTTTLAAQLAATGDAVAWCRLAPGYDRVADVVEAAIAATPTAEGDTPAMHPVEAAEQLLDLFDAGLTTLVVDDHHLAENGDIDRVIAECADLLPAGARIVVAGESRPAGLMGRVSPNRIALLGSEELAFTSGEGRALFESHGSTEERAEAWRRAVGGWAQAMVGGACAPDSDPAEYLDSLIDRHASPSDADVLVAAAALPYVSAPLLDAIGIDGAVAALDRLIVDSPLLTDHGGSVRMSADAAARLRNRLGDDHVRTTREAAASWLVDEDPVTAIDVLLDVGDHEGAADVLADHLTEIGVDRALTWLYRLPADLRRRFPPVLAAGQATVEVDTALATAQLRVETAESERSRREALLALGSIEAHRGELAAAASALEAALRASRDDAQAQRRISGELATTRFLLGDVAGARVALADAEPTTAAQLLAVQLDLVDGDAAARTGIDINELTGDDAFADAARALAALASDDPVSADDSSARARAAGIEVGGEALVAGALVRSLVLVRADRNDDAELVVDEMERRLGPRHRLSRVVGAVVRERISRVTDDRSRHERDERRLRDQRQAGYALIEQLVDRLLDTGDDAADAAPGVVVHVLGEHVVEVGGRTIRRSEWKSKKALEVLTVLAAAGARGARREALIEEVWPGRDPDKGRTLLRTALSEIRRMLEPGRPTGEPSTFLTAADDVIRLDGALDLDLAEAQVSSAPTEAFAALRRSLPPEVETAEWAHDWAPRVERLLVTAASGVPHDAPPEVRVDALEALIGAEPWQRDHYDALASLHRESGDDAAAADVERRWFADDD